MEKIIDINMDELLEASSHVVGAPPIPKGYKVGITPDGHTVAYSPKMLPGRIYILLEEKETGKSVWYQAVDQHNTLPIREFMIAQGLRMEIKFPGMRMTAKAPKCSTILRKEYGMTGNPQSLLEQFLAFRSIELKEA